MIYYSDMRKMLQDNVPGFAARSKPTQIGIVKAISASLNPNRRGGVDAECIPQAYIKKCGHKPDVVCKALVDLGLVVFGEDYVWSSNGTGRARDCYPTELLRNLPFSEYDSNVMQYREIRKRGKTPVYRDKEPDTTPRVIDGVTIHHPYVDMDALQHFISVGYKHTECPELWRTQAQLFQHLASAPNLPYGMLLQDYQVNERTHRIDGVGRNIQNQDKLLRSALLNQSTDYDISNAHYSIIDNLYPTVYIKHYVRNAVAMRHEIALDTQNTYKGVKQSLLAMLYGAHPTRSLTEYLAYPLDFWHHPYVSAIRQEAKPITQMGDSGPLYLMQEEQKIVKSITRTRDNIVLPMHDGWVEANPEEKNPQQKTSEEKNLEQKTLEQKNLEEKNLEEMAAIAKKYTGYNITITQEVISYGFPSQ